MTITREELEQLQEAARLGLLNPRPVEFKHVALTGTASIPRVDMTLFIAALRGVVEKSVTRRTQVLIVGDTGRHGQTNKVREAQARGVRIMTEAEFISAVTTP